MLMTGVLCQASVPCLLIGAYLTLTAILFTVPGALIGFPLVIGMYLSGPFQLEITKPTADTCPSPAKVG